MSDELIAAALRWAAIDPDEADQATVRGWVEQNKLDALQAAFGARLSFGTAGLRGPLQPGPAGMNRLQVRQVTAGLLAWLDAQGAQGPVVVAFDGRRGSRVFADDVARVVRATGREAHRFVDMVPTPVLAFSVRELGAAAGVMVTASHNPPDDNGYKVFWADGAQIVPPHDEGISGRIPDGSVEVADDDGSEVPQGLIDRYVEQVKGLRVHTQSGGLRVVYTPLHGVGRVLVERVLRESGYTDLHVVPEQGEPDGRFPTVAFPNPEEEGALDLAMALATEVGADSVIANDPDADRLAVAIPRGGGWKRLSGNELGWLLADDLLSHGSFPEPRGVATTLVSSTRLAALAAHHGVAYAETLTGFKWLARVSMQLGEAGGTLVLGYEEALGYSIGGLVRDKDGVSAALLLCDLAAWAKGQGLTLQDLLDRLDERYGVYAGRQCSRVHRGADGALRIQAAMASFRATPPVELGGFRVMRVSDLAEPGGELPPSNVLAYHLEGGHRALVRPSGTEPKLKLYVEARAEVTAGLADARARAAVAAAAIEDALLKLV